MATADRRPRPSRPLKLAPLLTLGEETDAEGRLLLEDSAPSRARRLAERRGVAMATETCTYPDSPSRQGGQYNVSAYEALRAQLGPMLCGFSWLAENYRQRCPDRAETVAALYDTSYLAMHLPLVLFHRLPDPIEAQGALPPYVAAMFKAARGIFSATINLTNQPGSRDRPLTAAQALDFAESKGHLRRRQTGRVCAAPQRLIERTLGVMLTGRGADPAGCDLATLVDFDQLWRFHLAHERLNDQLNGYRSVLERAMAAGGAGGPDPRTLFATPVTIGTARTTLGAHTQAVVTSLGEIQAELNAVVGRQGPNPGVTFEELTKLL